MSKAFALIPLLIAGALPTLAFADAAPPVDPKITSVDQMPTQTGFKPFTGKIVGNHVRMRTGADLESHIISELSKDDYVVVAGEHGDFYAVEAPSDLKAYIFRGFVIDDVVEGDRVNVRLAPDRDATVIGHYSTGQHIDGKICDENNKWLEINAPKETRFFIAKEYIEYAGKPELKGIQDKRKETVTQLLESTHLLSQAEMRKAFPEIDIERVTHSYQTIMTDYADFPKFATKAAKELSGIQEDYLHRKIAFLEARASKMGKPQTSEDIYEVSYHPGETQSLTDRMKVWESYEEALFLSWASMHHAKTMDDFYADQKMKCQAVSGILECYREPVKNKPGDFVLKDHDITVAYLYSTQVNLDDYIGKRVNLLVSPRPNNNFAFPAYYVIEVE
ncbi:MAG: SH3 domain-containing protein [Chlamydiales bacterium]|nr:SH3 domain-containing protein [Chlamydiales bacterium]